MASERWAVLENYSDNTDILKDYSDNMDIIKDYPNNMGIIRKINLRSHPKGPLEKMNVVDLWAVVH